MTTQRAAQLTVEELYTAWREYLIAYFAKTVAYEEAEDLTHELFARYLAAQANGTQIVQPRRYLWRAARNLLTDVYRAKARSPICTSLDDLQLVDLLTPEPLDLALDWDDRTDVAPYLPMLTPAQLEVVSLHCRHDWGHQQVADALGIPLGAAKARHRRAVAKLREFMADSG
jgi:RNA polymerase sigma-70 factor, ECF subfamily